MTARDPELQHAVDRAAGELARRLRPWATGMADPDAFARAYIEWQYGQEGWRPWPHLDDRWRNDTGRPDPDAARRGAARARDLLNKRTEGDPP